MGPVLLSLGIVLFLGSCRTVTTPNNGNDSSTNGGSGTSAIDGVVLKGPIMPVSKPGESNTAPLAGAPITITNATNSTVIANVVSDTAGKFFVQVAAGSYILTPNQISGSVFPRPPQAQTVQVPANTTFADTLNYDTGIR